MATIERGPSPFDGLEPAEVSAWLANPVTERIREQIGLRLQGTRSYILECYKHPGVLPDPQVGAELRAQEAADSDMKEAERYARGQ